MLLLRTHSATGSRTHSDGSWASAVLQLNHMIFGYCSPQFYDWLEQWGRASGPHSRLSEPQPVILCAGTVTLLEDEACILTK
jgi:hypothetical protein